MKIQIRKLCDSRGIKSGNELATLTGLTVPTAYRAYRDDIKQFTPQTLEKLCRALDCKPNHIFGYDDVQMVKPKSARADAEKPASTPGTPKTSTSVEGMLTVKQAAEQLGRSPRQVRTYAIEGKLEGVQGKQGHWFFYQTAVDEYKKTFGE